MVWIVSNWISSYNQLLNVPSFISMHVHVRVMNKYFYSLLYLRLSSTIREWNYFYVECFICMYVYYSDLHSIKYNLIFS